MKQPTNERAEIMYFIDHTEYLNTIYYIPLTLQQNDFQQRNFLLLFVQSIKEEKIEAENYN